LPPKQAQLRQLSWPHSPTREAQAPGSNVGKLGAVTSECLRHVPSLQSATELSPFSASRGSGSPTPLHPSSPPQSRLSHGRGSSQRPTPSGLEESSSLNTACLLESKAKDGVLKRPSASYLCPSWPFPWALLWFCDRLSRRASIGNSASVLHGRTLSPRTCEEEESCMRAQPVIKV